MPKPSKKEMAEKKKASKGNKDRGKC